jgi:multiple sugar transport system substrate-binding protein
LAASSLKLIASLKPFTSELLGRGKFSLSEPEEKKITRRRYLEVAGGTIAGLVVGGALGYLAKPTTTAPAITVTSTATETVTSTGVITPPPMTTAPLGGKISILGFTGALGDALIPVIDAFQKNSGITVDYERIGYDELAEKGASLMTVKDTSYDIICQDDPFTPKFYEAGWFEPWENFGWTRDTDIFDGCVDLGTWPTPEYMGPVPPGARQKTPRQYAVGWGGGPCVNYTYRTDKLEELGLKEAATWDDVEMIAKAANNPSKSFYGWVNRGTKGDPISFDTFPIFFDYGLESIFDDTWHCIADGPQGVAALTKYLAIAKYGPPGMSNYGATEQGLDFVGGRVMQGLPVPGDVISDVEDASKSKSAGKLKWMLPPAGPAKRTTIIGLFCMGISAYSQNKASAWKFIDYFLSKEGQTVYTTEGKTWPLRRSLFTDPAINSQPWVKPLYPGSVDMFDAHPKPYPRTTLWLSLVDIWGGYLNLALTGQISAQAALTKAKGELETELKRAGYIS